MGPERRGGPGPRPRPGAVPSRPVGAERSGPERGAVRAAGWAGGGGEAGGDSAPRQSPLKCDGPGRGRLRLAPNLAGVEGGRLRAGGGGLCRGPGTAAARAPSRRPALRIMPVAAGPRPR